MSTLFNIDHIPLDIDLDSDSVLDEYLDLNTLKQDLTPAKLDLFSTILVIDGAPIVEEVKRDKLFSVIRKQFLKENVKIKENGFYMPMEQVNSKSMSKGFIFVDMESITDANLALKTLQLHKFDRSHTFVLNKLSDIEKYSKIVDDWDQQKAVGEKPEYIERGFLRDWQLDPSARDQFAIYNQDSVSLLWCNKDKAPDVVVERAGWTDGYIAWSPLGSYLTSVHTAGIAIWGTKEMVRLQRFYHPGVRFLDFSPLESFVVTFSPDPVPNTTDFAGKPWGPESVGHQVLIWNVQSGRLARSFSLTKDEISAKNIAWPLFKWSSDEKYFARIMNQSKIVVYESSNFLALDKKPISLPGVTEFEFMPNDGGSDDHTKKRKSLAPPHVIAYFIPQSGNDKPAQLALMSLPNRQIIRQKQVFFGLSAKIHFHPQGEFLLYKVDRTNRSGKASYVSLEVFRLCEKDFPVDSLDVQLVITAFAWEPMGNRFALVLTPDVPGPDLDLKTVMAGVPGKMLVRVYEVEPAGGMGAPGGIVLMKELDRKSCNSVFWSPKGRFVVFAGLRNLQGVLEFYDMDVDGNKEVSTSTVVNGKTVTAVKNTDRVALLAASDHYAANEVAWDPTGRFVVTCVTMWGKSADHGYCLFDMCGSLVSKQPRASLKQALWRPRPRTLCSSKQLKHMRKNMKQYVRQFEMDDELVSSAMSKADWAERARLFQEWAEFRSNALLQLEHQFQVEAVVEG